MNTQIVHQIWIGSDLPTRESAWVATVREAAEGAGWSHRLWLWRDLEQAFGGEPLAAVFRQLMEDFPMATTYTLMADYYRLRVLAESGGVYLDADFHASSWPDFPTDVDISLLMEFFAPGRACNGYFCCRRPDAMRLAAELAEKHLLEQLPLNAVDLPARYIGMVRRDGGRGGLVRSGVGPGFFRRVVLSAWRKNGISFAFAPRSVVGHRQWSEASALTHYGAAHWHEGGRRSGDVFWGELVIKAESMSANNDRRERQLRMGSVPEHLRPCAGSLPPQRRPRAEAAQASCSQTAVIPPQFHIPRDVRRIVVTSNVTTGFSLGMLPLRAGDLVLHCNHARHRAEAMAVKGTRHWLLVRHGKGRDPRGWHWYHEGTFDGFEKVFFVDDATMMRPFRWWRDFRAISKKSPTTGFIAANIMREAAPHLPLILAGFDPGVEHGTPQWDGHAWDVEAKWYAERKFTLYRPRAQVRILLLVSSCISYSGRALRAKGAGGTYEQRRACRLAWLNKLTPHNVQARMIVGRGVPMRERLVRQIDAADDFQHLPEKTQAMFKDALATADFDWLVKCDDDSFMHLERLVQYVASLPLGSHDIYGAAPSNGRRDCVCGGGGYVLHRDAVEAIVNDAHFPATGREDVEVCRSVVRNGGKVVQVQQFNAEASPSPAPGNDLISCHHLTPAAMQKIHIDCWKL